MKYLLTASCLALLTAGTFLSQAEAAKKPPVPTVTYTNNLSNPVIFAEGTGITGLPTAESTGLRGGSVPYLVEPYLYNGVTYYLQQTQNSWQADWVNGQPGGEVVEVDWSDNIVRTTWSASSVIRVEVVLDKELTTPLNGYDMTYLFGEGIAEVWGTTGTKIPASLPTVYSICARHTIQKLDGPNGNVVGTLYNSAIYDRFGVDGLTYAYAAEVNVPGKIIYGYNWDLGKFDMASIGLPTEPKSGWYRLSYSLDPLATYTVTDANGTARTFATPCNTVLGAVNPLDQLGTTVPELVLYPAKLVSGTLSTLEIYVKPATGKK